MRDRILASSLVFLALGCDADPPTAVEAPTEAAPRIGSAVGDADAVYRIPDDPLADPLLRRAIEPVLDLQTALRKPPGERPDLRELLNLLDARAAERPDDRDAAIARAVLELTLADRDEAPRPAENGTR